MNEVQAGALHLYAKLSGAAAVTALVSTRIYDDVAPQGATLPYLRYHLPTPAQDTLATLAHRLLSTQRWTVLAWAESGSYAEADAIALAADNALHQTTGSQVISAVTYTILGCYRRSSVRFTQLNAGRTIRVVGGTYDVLVTTC